MPDFNEEDIFSGLSGRSLGKTKSGDCSDQLIRVIFKGEDKWSTVSIDVYLYMMLSGQVGGEEQARIMIASWASEMYSHPSRKCVGLSRLVQRKIYRFLFGLKSK